MANVAEITIKAVDDASGVLGRIGEGLTGLGEIAKRAGEGLIALGVAAAGVGIAAVKAGTDFQTMTTQIANNTTMTTSDIGVMNDTIKQLSSETGAPLDQLANGFMHAFNMMGNTTDASKVLDIALRSAVSTGSDVSSVTETLAKVMHQFNIPVADAAKTMDELHLASALGNTTLEEFTSSTAKAMVSAANLHVPLEDVLAGFVGLTRAGYDAANASTQIAGIIQHLVAPSAAARKEIALLSKTTGIDLVGDFSLAGIKAKGLTAIMQDIEAATRGNEDAILKLIPAQRGAIGALALTGNSAKDVSDAMTQLNGVINGGATPTMVAYTRTTETLGFQWDVLKARFNLAKIALGDELMPTVMKALNWIMDEAPKASAALAMIFHAISTGDTAYLTQQLAKWLGVIQNWITGTAIPAVKGFLVPLGEKFWQWIVEMTPKALDEIQRFTAFLTEKIKQYGPVLLNNLLVWGIAFVDFIKPYIGPMVEKLGELFVALENWLISKVPMIQDQLAKWADEFVHWIAPHIPAMLLELGKLWIAGEEFMLSIPLKLAALLVTWGIEFVKWVAPQIPDMLTELGTLAQRLLQWITDRVPDLVNHIGDWIKAFVVFPIHVAEQLPGALDNVLDGINRWVDSIIPRIEAKGRDMAGALLRGLGNMAGNILGGIGGAIGIGGGGSSPNLSYTTPGTQQGVTYNGHYYAPGDTFHYADGGWLNEPVLGMGMNSGNRYSFAENGSELILNQSQVRGLSSGGGGGGSTIIVNVAGSITTARGVAEDVRTELLRMQRQGIKLGFT